MILKFRQNRIQQYKQVFPSLRQNIINRDSQNCFNAQIEMSGIERRHSMERKFRVSDNIAPSTMFQRMKGQTNPDLIEQVFLYCGMKSLCQCILDSKKLEQKFVQDF
jgi:hypothetical protein